jgi:peptidyl-prolyl cis-trans isomerase D
MTMLDRMRRHKNWLKWSLAIVVLAFILLYIPDFMRHPNAAAGPSTVVASVDGREITVGRFRRAYQQQMQAYRQAYGAQMDERMLKQLGFEQRIIQQMLEEETALAEAERLGIGATDEEVRQRILALPAFQDNGHFIGDERYRQMLNLANPPMRPDEFEDQMRRSVTVEKLQAALTNWITLPDKELDSEVLKRNEKVKLAVVSFPADKFREGLTATDAELAAQYEQHKNDYKVGDKRKVRYALIDMQSIRARTQITPQEIQKSFDENQQQYSTPEQVRASHILLKTEGKDDAAVKKQAEDLLAKVKAGADFAKLATEFSEDEGSKTKGGDLDFFGKGAMVPEFDKVAFALQPGQVNDTVVKSQFGYHIIKVTDKKAGTSKTLAEVRPQIEDQLKWERAQNDAQKVADDLASKIRKPSDLDSVAAPRGLVVSESGFFGKDEPIAGLGMAPAVAERAFALKDGEVSEAIRTPQGFAFITVTGKKDAYVPALEEAKPKVREDVLKKKAIDAARAKAATLDAQLKAGDFDKTAKAAGLDVKTTDLIARGAPIAEIGVSPAIDAVAFKMPAGAVSDPIVTDTGAVIVKVTERKDPTATELTAARDQTRNELLSERRNRFYSAYMTKARQRMKININHEVLVQMVA